MTTNELQLELEQIIDWFESEEADIDEAAAKYKRGLEIVEELKKRLNNTKNEITKLNKNFSD